MGGDDSEVLGPRPGSLEWRASLALKVLAGINAAGILLATIPASIPASALQAFAFNVASGALAVLYVIVALALDRRQQWAVWAIRPLLVLLLVWGAYTFVSALAAGAIRIPFTTLAAGWALLGSADRRPLPSFSSRGGAVLVASIALIAMVLAGRPLFGWGGFFDVHERDLTQSLAVDCGTPGAAPPERIAITYEWSWSNGTLLANEDDVVIIGWNGDDAGGNPLYVLGETPEEAGEGIRLGSSSGVSSTMSQEAAAHWRGSIRWAIDLSARGIRPGHTELVLMRAAEQSREAQELVVGATYVHVGVWQKDAATVTCSW